MKPFIATGNCYSYFMFKLILAYIIKHNHVRIGASTEVCNCVCVENQHDNLFVYTLELSRKFYI